MSYAPTDVLVYGVRVSHAEARELLPILGRAGYGHELARDFTTVRSEWRVESWALEAAYEELETEGTLDVYGFAYIDDPVEFYDHFDFPACAIPREEVETITWSSYDGKTYSRYRYFVDLVCEGADSRGDSLRLLPEHDSYFGVVLGSHGYGYTDPLAQLAASCNAQVPRNYARYCEPLLLARGIHRSPQMHYVNQIW